MLLLYGSHAIIKIFIASALIGTLGEYFMGHLFFLLHGKPVWEYEYLPIGRFTSWLSVLYWGGAGLLFVKIADWIQ